MADDIPLTQAIMSNLLRSHVQTEGVRHQWGLEFSADSGIPLLLTWDQFPGSQPSKSDRMLSRAPCKWLDTWKARKTFLAVHADHKSGNLLRSHSCSHRQSYKIMPNGESGKEAVNNYGGESKCLNEEWLSHFQHGCRNALLWNTWPLWQIE